MNMCYMWCIFVCREEATAIIHGAHSRKESGALAAYEEQMNDVRCHKIVYAYL